MKIKSLFQKKSFFLAGGCLGLILFVLVAIPFFIDVDTYRPELLKAVNSRLNGSLSLGKLKLSLLGKISVGVENAELKDESDRVVLAVGKFDLRIPILALITGRPAVYVNMTRPILSAHRDKKGDWNFIKLKKEELDSTPSKANIAPEAPTESRELPSWTRKATVGVKIDQADLKISDDKTGSQYGIRNLDINADSLSLSQASSFSLRAVVDSTVNEKSSIKGPFEIKGKVNGENILLEAQLQKLIILYGNQFRKDDTIPANLRIELKHKPQEIEVKTGSLQFHTARVDFEGSLENWDAPEGGKLNLKMVAPGVDLGSFSTLLVGVDKSALQGSVKARLALEGTTLKPNGLVEADLDGVKFRGENFKQDLEIAGQLKATLKKVDKLAMQVKAEGFDLRVTTQINNFENPQLSIVCESNEMDLDKLLDWEKMKKANIAKLEKKKASESSPTKADSSGNPVNLPDYDTPLKVLNNNSVVKKAKGDISLMGKSLKFYNVVIEPIKGKFSLSNLRLVGSFEEARIFDGTTKLSAQLDFSGDRPRYGFQIPVTNIELQKAVASQFEILKNTMTGSLSGEMTGKGESFNPVLAKKNLVASGKMRVSQSKLSSIDIGKILSESTGEIISKVGDKIPGLKGKNLQPGAISSEFQQITGSFSVKDGEFVSPDFFAQAIPQKGVDVRGDTRVGLIDYSLHADWEISDTYNLLRAKEIALEEGGNRVDSILLEKGQPLKLPIRVRGTLLSPQYDYGAVPDSLLRIAMANISRAAQEKAKAAVKGKAQEEVKKLTEKAPQQIKDVLKGIFK